MAVACHNNQYDSISVILDTYHEQNHQQYGSLLKEIAIMHCNYVAAYDSLSKLLFDRGFHELDSPTKKAPWKLHHQSIEELAKLGHATSLRGILDHIKPNNQAVGNEPWPEKPEWTLRHFAIYTACINGQIDCLRELLIDKPFSDQPWPNKGHGYTMHHYALSILIEHNQYQCLSTLLFGVEIENTDPINLLITLINKKNPKEITKELVLFSNTLLKSDDTMIRILKQCTKLKKIKHLKLFEQMQLIKPEYHLELFIESLKVDDTSIFSFWLNLYAQQRIDPKSMLLILESISNNNAMSQFLQYTTQNKNGIVLFVALIETLFNSNSRATRKIIENNKVTIIKLLQAITKSQETLPFQNTNDDTLFSIVKHVIGMRPAEATKQWDNEVLLPLLRCIQPERIQAKCLEIESLIDEIGQTNPTRFFLSDLKHRVRNALETMGQEEILNELERDTNELLTDLTNQLQQSPQNQKLTQLAIFIINKLCVEKKLVKNINKIETLFDLVSNQFPSRDLVMLKRSNNISQSMKKRIIDVERGRLESLITKLKEHNKTQEFESITLLNQNDRQALYLHINSFQQRTGDLVIDKSTYELSRTLKFKQENNAIMFSLKRNDRLSFFAPQETDIDQRFLFSGTPIRKASPNQIYAISYKGMSLYDLSNEIKKAAKMMLSKVEFNELENKIECWITDLDSTFSKDRVSKSMTSSIDDNIGGECKMGC